MGPTEIFARIANIEEKDRARRGLERRMSRSCLEKFKPMADFEIEGESYRLRESQVDATTSSKSRCDKKTPPDN